LVSTRVRPSVWMDSEPIVGKQETDIAFRGVPVCP
jgi:hypothetical protein